VVNLKVTNIRLPEKILANTDRLAKKNGLNRSEIIRQALTIYLHIVENAGTIIRPLAFQVTPAQIGYTRRGNVSILRIPTGHAIVVGSTSSGAVGPKSIDEIKVEGKTLGKFLGRVAMMDVAATGAFPLLISAALGVEKEPTGREIIAGIQREALVLGLEPSQVMLENTEENFSTVQTGVGLTVVGFANEEELRLGKTRPGDIIVAVGKPKVGSEVISAEVRGEIADLKCVLWLSQKKYVHDIVPVGDLGIITEARMIAHAVGHQLKLKEKFDFEIKKSVGPATVVLVTIDPEKYEDLASLVKKPVNILGEVV
jgi:Ribbon-helix-helix protein, copG family/AIR synthase related protein, N-terminal domain